MVEMHQSELALSFLLGQETQQEDLKPFIHCSTPLPEGACNTSELSELTRP